MSIWIYLGLVFLCICAYMWSFKRRKQELKDLFHQAELQEACCPRRVFRRRHFKALSILTSLLLLTMLCIRQEEADKTQHKHNAELLIILDNSLSMLAEDSTTRLNGKEQRISRFDKAKEVITTIIKSLNAEHKAGLILIAKHAQIESPTTTNKEFLLEEHIKQALIALDFKQGTKLSEAFAQAIWLFRSSHTKNKSIILLSDGEDQGSRLKQSIAQLRSEQIEVFTIGFGQKTGALIPLSNQNKAHYKRNIYGEAVLTKRNDKILKLISTATGGKHYSPLPQSITSLSKRLQEKSSITERHSPDNTALVLTIYIILLLGLLISEKARFHAAHSQKFTIAAALSIIITAASTPRQDSGPQLTTQANTTHLEEGNKRFHNQDYTGALQSYQEALRHEQPRSKLHYNSGRALSKLKRYQEALQSYKKALILDPQDKAAGFHYYSLKKQLQAAQKNQSERPESSNEDSQGSQEKSEYFNKEFLDTLMKNQDLQKEQKNNSQKDIESPQKTELYKKLAQRDRLNRYQILPNTRKKALSFHEENDW